MMTSNLDITQEGSHSSVERLVGTIELGEFADWEIFADLQQHSSHFHLKMRPTIGNSLIHLFQLPRIEPFLRRR